MTRAKAVLPIAQRKGAYLDRRLCDNLHGLQDKRAELEVIDGYKSSSLDERLEIRRDFDAVIAETTRILNGGKCLIGK